ncbi:terminase large subunit domain-containing protein, partial [Staphylococcus aureus]|uniref:terminase large subunit domain-containing protein n=1 Tax=Staphylococcus aureus TaxID=1280 RepID=UPI00301C2121
MGIELSAHQGIFLNGMKTKYRAYVGGFGSGKTFVGCLDNLTFAAKHPGTRQGYFGPTYGAIRDIFYPTYDEAAELLGFTTKVNVGNKEVHLYRNGFYYGTTICRSMDNQSSIVVLKISRALTDELDVL